MYYENKALTKLPKRHRGAVCGARFMDDVFLAFSTGVTAESESFCTQLHHWCCRLRGSLLSSSPPLSLATHVDCIFLQQCAVFFNQSSRCCSRGFYDRRPDREPTRGCGTAVIFCFLYFIFSLRFSCFFIRFFPQVPSVTHYAEVQLRPTQPLLFAAHGAGFGWCIFG